MATKAELAELLGVNPDDYKKDELQQMVDDLPSEAEEVEPVVVEAKDKKVKVYGLEDKDMVIGPYDVHIKKSCASRSTARSRVPTYCPWHCN